MMAITSYLGGKGKQFKDPTLEKMLKVLLLCERY